MNRETGMGGVIKIASYAYPIGQVNLILVLLQISN